MKLAPGLWRAPLLALAAGVLTLGVWGGLARIGWAVPIGPLLVTVQHGPLMVCGFLGALIGLERAVALAQGEPRARWAYAVPVCASVGLVLAAFGAPAWLARGLTALAAFGFTLVAGLIVRRQRDLAHGTMAVGAHAWLVGTLLWGADVPLARCVPWWMAFLVLTVVGERLELGRVMRPGPWVRVAFGGAVAVTVGGAVLGLAWPDGGARMFGAGLVLLGVWLLRYDIARRTVRLSGVTRFSAICLLAGYVWLSVGGLMWMGWGAGYVAGPYYDALLHSVFLGFIMSLVFGHAPIVAAGVLGLTIAYHRVLYAALIVLHGALVARIAGDLLGWSEVRLWGGLFNALALLLFVLSIVGVQIAARRAARAG